MAVESLESAGLTEDGAPESMGGNITLLPYRDPAAELGQFYANNHRELGQLLKIGAENARRVNELIARQIELAEILRAAGVDVTDLIKSTEAEGLPSPYFAD